MEKAISMLRRTTFKQLLVRSAWASYWVAAVHSKCVGLLALRHRARQIGHCHIAWSAKVTGWAECSFGVNSVIGARTWININDRRGKPAVEIGENAFIGQDNFLTSGSLIRIGPYCLTASHCSFIGSTHIVENPMLPYATSGTSNDACIDIGANCFFGFGAMVLGNVCIGHGSIIGAGAVVRHDVPPFSLVAGNPAKVVKHFDFQANLWLAGPRNAAETDSMPLEQDYLRQLQTKCRYPIQPVSAASTWLADI